PASTGCSAMPPCAPASPGLRAIARKRNSASTRCSTGWKACFVAPPMATATAERGNRFAGRARVVARAGAARLASAGPRPRPADPQRILIAHHLRLGDTLMLTALVAKLREQHRSAELVMAVPEAYAPLYAGAPYGLRAIGWNPRRPADSPLWRERGF